MEFKIKRSSDSERKPCREAYRGVEVTHHELDGTINTNWTEADNAKWLSNPQIKNFRIEGDRQFWDIEEKVWFVSINSLEKLMAFEKKYGLLIISGDTIEIYDDYRE